MSTQTYAKSNSLLRRIRIRPLAGAGRIEIAVIAATLLAGVLIGVALNSFVLGFAALVVIALFVRLILEVVGTRATV